MSYFDFVNADPLLYSNVMLHKMYMLYICIAFSNMHIFAAFYGCPLVMSDRTHIDIRCTHSVHSKNVYKDNFLVERCVKMNYFAIFRCTTNTGHH